MQVKIFARTTPRGVKSSDNSAPLEVAQLESEINTWLDSHHNVKIKEIKQSQSGGSWAPAKVVVSIWYEEVESLAT